MAFRLKVEGGVVKIAVTIPRATCVSEASRDRRTLRTFHGPEHVARAICEQGNSLIFAAERQGERLRAVDTLRQAMRNLRGQLPGASPEAAAMLVSDYAPSWLESVGRDTARTYKSVYHNHIEPTFGSVSLAAVKGRLVREWVESLERGDSPKAPATVGTYFRVLSAMLRQAVRDGEIPRHPCPSLSSIRPRRKVARKPPPALEANQLVACLRELDSLDHDPARRLAPYLMAATGVRIGECVALQWGDLRGRVLTVQRTRKFDGRFGATKGRNVRSVELADSTLARMTRARIVGSKWIVARPDGEPWSDQAVTKTWYAAMDAAGIPRLKPHGIRHTRATLWLQAGEAPQDVADWLGHSLQTLYRTYAHAMPSRRSRSRVDLEETVG